MITFYARDDRLAGQSPRAADLADRHRRHRLRRLTSNEAGAVSARWSPDGSTIAFLSRGSVFVHARGGGTPRQVSKRTGVTDIAWHPDGAAIYFLAADPPTDAERERQRLRGDIACSTRRASATYGRWRSPTAPRPESRTATDYIFAYRIAAKGERIIISRRPTRAARRLRQDGALEHRGRRQRAVQLTSNAVPEEEGELSPDGSQVLFLARANDRQEPYYNANVFLVPATGGQARALMPDFPHEVLRAGWAADSKSIWMVVNMGVHISSCRSISPRRTAADHERRSCTRAAVVEHRRRTSHRS